MLRCFSVSSPVITFNIVNLFEHTILSNGYNHRSVFQETVFTLTEPISVREFSVTRQSPLGLWRLLLRRKTVSLICALKTAGKKEMLTIAFTGKDGGRIVDAANYCFIVPSFNIHRIRECHVTLLHII